MSVAEIIVQEITPYLRPGVTLWVAFSGGLDSSVLLHVLARSGLADRSRAIHVNHQLSPRADAWQDHCQKCCAAHAIDFVCDKVVVDKQGRGIEAAARDLRYRVFARRVKRDDLLLFAHHLDDQAETFLFRLVRGTGVAGLAAMKKCRRFHAAHIVRPMLPLTRAQIKDYAAEHGLSWIEDESNDQCALDRNYLRHRVVPVLRKRWRDASHKIAMAARWLSEADELLDEYAGEDLQRCELRRERVGESIALAELLAFSRARQKQIVRAWCRKNFALTPQAAQLEALADMCAARPDATPLLSWHTCQFRRFKNRLFLMAKVPAFAPARLVWTGTEPLQLPDGSLLECAGAGREQRWTVTFRRGGERCKPRARARSQSLKKLLQEYALEPWLRDRVPLVYAGEQLLAVGDLFICDNAVTQALPELCLRWRQPALSVRSCRA